jgi:hypothetical protein
MFVLHWQEIFDRRTPDTWQVRTTNFRAILVELIEVIGVCVEHPLYKHNIPVLLAEARACAKIDPVLNEHFPEALAMLPVDDKVFTGENAGHHQSELRRRVQVILGQLQRYPQVLIQELRTTLSAEDEKPKRRLYYLTMALATEWAAQGYSWSHLSGLTHGLMAPKGGLFIDRFDELILRCNGELRAFRCRVGLTLPHAADVGALSLPNIQFHRGRPAELKSGDEITFYGAAAPEDVFADVAVNALDPVVARRAAEERISELFAALNLFLPDRQFNFRGRYALVWDENPGMAMPAPLLVSLRQFKEHGLRPTEDSAAHVSRYFEGRRRLPDDDADQINSAMQYHRIALSAAGDEARLVNLWIALETLCRRSSDGEKIIDSICRQIAPCVAVNNLRKVMTGLAVYIHQFRGKMGLEIEKVRSLFPTATIDEIPASELLDVLMEPEDGARINGLMTMLGQHPLLCFRVYRHRDLLRDRKRVCDSLEQHRLNVDWQLRRIYRARNDVMHRGRGSAVLPRLIQHLHTYLGVTLYNLLYDLHNHTGWTLPDALKHRELLFNSFLKRLRASHVPLAVLLSPELILRRAPIGPSWPPKEEGDNTCAADGIPPSGGIPG